MRYRPARQDQPLDVLIGDRSGRCAVRLARALPRTSKAAVLASSKSESSLRYRLGRNITSK